MNKKLLQTEFASMGGVARAKKLSKERRVEIAKKANTIRNINLAKKNEQIKMSGVSKNTRL